ncbi:LacI family transcriptional regulator [Xaviernesmea oryzae]|uniref:LacI family transcriptional regulator n=1 Tax=Xaviernesmea oryzae TaxID=464029 RepID=A0A1Q9AQL5_9HYPH|nr:LacI family DNA-binding transcriptional regulator [Xaviernesmea oryzae]OLP57704.1 LacI family transcriptional regulator [Xaviernesmea oryzae]SEM05002.1 transcriptional regulator, LacI family [Xaviernesmea oryzae]
MVTIKEIAKAVGVSSATVSRVLNYDPALSISPAKRQAVIETAEALNYATPRSRKGLASLSLAPLPLARFAIVHFLQSTEELADPYYIGVRLGIEARCREIKAEIAKIYHADMAADPQVLQSVSGTIVIGKQSNDVIDWLAAQGRPLVFADFLPPYERFDGVHCDLPRATADMLDALEAAGYRRIAFIGSHEHLNGETQLYGERRCRAYIDWMTAHDLFDPSLLVLGDFCNNGQNLRLEAGYALAQQVLALQPRPDIVMTANDNMAIGAYRAIREAGLRIPEDIAVISFNDIPVAQFLTPPLSSLRIQGEYIGESAVDLMIERLAGRSYTKTVTIPSAMSWRESCRAPG